MKNVTQKRNKKGQTLLEIIAVLVIIGAILAAVIPAVTASTDNGRIASAVNAIRAIQSAAVGYYNDNGGSYASVSIANLAAKYLPTNFSGTSANPWAGNITVAENGTTTYQYVLTMTNVPTTAQIQLAKALQNTSVSTSTNATTNTFTAIFS
jgi:prepilin-type N-terminal cleavage/methylation domain-containing protein